MSTAIKAIIIIIVIITLAIGGLLIFTAYQEQQGKETFVSGLFPNLLDSFNPDNTIEDGDDDIQILPDSDNENDGEADTRAQIFQITQAPIVGYTLLPNNIVRYMEKGTGNIYDYNIETGSQNKVSNKTIERVQSVYWGENGNAFITQQITEDERVVNTYFSFNTPQQTTFIFETTLKPNDKNEEVKKLQQALNQDPETLVATSGVGSPGEESTLYGAKTIDAVKRFQKKYSEDILTPQGLTETTGIFDDTTRKKLNSLFEQDTITQETKLFEKPLSKAISSISSSPDGKKIFYLISNDSDNISGVVANFDGSQQKEILNFPFTEWTPSWNTKDVVLLTTKPSQEVGGSTYSLNINTGSLRRVFGDINGLTINGNSDNSFILYSQSVVGGNGVTAHVFDTKTNTQEIIPLTTLSEKCVWGNTQSHIIYCGTPKTLPVGMYPDNWYKGVIEFSDAVWKYDTNIRVQNIIIDLETQTLVDTIDVYSPSLTKDDETLLFIDKGDSSLWGLSLN